MAKQRVVSVKFWDDTYIMQLDPTEKLLFLYFLTNPLTNISGIYEITLRRISFDTGIDGNMVTVILLRLENDKKIIYRNGWLCIINFIKNQSLNPSVVNGIERELKVIPKDILVQLVTACPSLTQAGTLNLTKLNLTKLNAYATASKKPFYNNQPLVQKFGKWYVIERSGEILFTGKQSEIIYK